MIKFKNRFKQFCFAILKRFGFDRIIKNILFELISEFKLNIKFFESLKKNQI